MSFKKNTDYSHKILTTLATGDRSAKVKSEKNHDLGVQSLLRLWQLTNDSDDSACFGGFGVGQGYKVAREINLHKVSILRTKKPKLLPTMNIIIWYPATAANEARGEAMIREAQYANNAPTIPYRTRIIH